ncbi:MAG TPA: cytochrome c [Vicinamibacterales bacterium]|nr:cytochrome c [Vicinamibacterales bacterium]
MRRTIVLLSLAWTFALAGAAAQSPAPRIWQGVYTAAQAERGKSVYDTSCVRCHGADLAGTTAPPLKGERFMSTWGGETVSRLFDKIRDTMPPLFGTFVSEASKVDIVAYILHTNGYPAGKIELTGGNELASMQIVPRGDQGRVQNFALVQVVGCLQRDDRGWRLTNAAAPVATTANTPDVDALAQAAATPLGTDDYLLLSAAPFDPASGLGRKVEARGLIYNESGNRRLTLTSLKSVGTCT